MKTILISVTALLLWMGDSGNWTAPAEAKKLTNPLSGNVTAIEKGKAIFKQQCAMCHGNKGRGDGMAGMSLTPRPANLTSAKVQEQTDGEIFWKITHGRSPMPSYKSILSDEQRWQLVTYIRTLKKK